MIWVLAEIVLALGLVGFIIWWLLRSPQTTREDEDKKSGHD